jgi:phospholipid/cholesterol/gamma-HCH transport system substrate-binding protein
LDRARLHAGVDPAGAMRRLALIAAVIVVGAGAAAFGPSSSNGSNPPPYLVRAIFDDAAFAVSGEDVRIAGAPVGSIQSLDVTHNLKAAVTIAITDHRFTPFYANATCAIRPQSLIGEKFVDCDPGTSGAQALPKIKSGPGSGSYYLPVTQTRSPIDSDIVQNISQQPVRESLALIINEFGTALGARGSDLNAVIHRANPALGYTDQVFQILARQSRALAQLADDSQAVLAPLARDRQSITNFIVQANTTSVASAQRAADIARTFQLFPSFLRQLRPLMADLGSLADQGTPLMTDLGRAASALGRQFVNLTPFASAARKSLIDLGAASAQSQPALLATQPLANHLLALGNATRPAANLLDTLTASLDKTGAIEQLMALLFKGASAANGFDSLGHYLRTQLQAGSCTGFASTPTPGCNANFLNTGGAADLTSGRNPAGTPTRAGAPGGRAAGVRNQVIAQAVRQNTGASQWGTTLKGLLDYLIGSRK